MKAQIVLLVMLGSLLLGCSVEPPQVVVVTATPVPVTQTLTPEPTSTETITSTATLKPTATPDLRVIDIDPRQILLERDYLPPDGKYYLPNSYWISPHRNSEIISGMGVKEGQEYLARTGRIDGWWVEYERGTRKVQMPDGVYDNVIIYETVAGAVLTITDPEFEHCADNDLDWTPVERKLDIGDFNTACVRRTMQNNGTLAVTFNVMFSYRNIVHNIYVWDDTGSAGNESNSLDFIISIAEMLLLKLQSLPLSSEVTFRP